jgi:cyclopropane fatty-acyl-phospholipid synthase-like methyltransferase
LSGCRFSGVLIGSWHSATLEKQLIMNRDFFARKAAVYDKAKHRTANVDNIAKAVLASIELNREMRMLDFGSGTGLLLERLATHVASITAVDVSDSMNEQLAAKRATLPCELHILPVDLTQTSIPGEYDVIVSSMTLHHIADIPGMLTRLFSLLRPGGQIALADLDAEDGTFHTEDTGVFHHGFERTWLQEQAEKAGFVEVRLDTAGVVHKPQGNYPVFLLTASKQ